MERAKETFIEIDWLITVAHWNTAANRMYYACFYAVGALLLTQGIKTSTHSGTLHKFTEVFIHPGRVAKESARVYAELFDKRQKADYSDNFDLDEQTVRRLYKPCIDFINQIESLVHAANPES
jgi:uncharacterized protein (UPF0332 family)